MLKRLLSDEIKLVGMRNVVSGRAFSEMLAGSVLRYQNHSLDAAAVVAELVALAKQLKHEHERGVELGLGEDELAFYDAICQNDSAVMEMGDDTLKTMTRACGWSGSPTMRRSTGAKRSRFAHVCGRPSRRLLVRRGYPARQAARRD